MKAAERRQNLRVALIDAAERAIAAGGLEALKARRLAEEVGCAVGGIYNVFPDLDALILEVNARTLAALDATIAAAVDGDWSKVAADKATAKLLRLGNAYLDFATANTLRWRALFDHRMAGGEPIPDWYADAQRHLFRLIEEPLAELRPDRTGDNLMLAARTLFSAIHGVVDLGLDQKLVALPPEALRAEIVDLVCAFGRGFAAPPPVS